MRYIDVDQDVLIAVLVSHRGDIRILAKFRKLEGMWMKRRPFEYISGSSVFLARRETGYEVTKIIGFYMD